MTRVDFYILNSGDKVQRFRFVCRLAEKAFTHGHRLFIHAPTGDEQRHLDDVLWSFRQGSFIPHALAETGLSQSDPILIGETPAPDKNFDVYVNLDGAVPSRFERYARIAEIVSGNTPSKEAARERFRIYRRAGIEIFSHNVDNERSQGSDYHV